MAYEIIKGPPTAFWGGLMPGFHPLPKVEDSNERTTMKGP
jgi:hypothetical protein